MKVHAEALTLMERLGISYKDACHRIFIAQQQRVIAADINALAWEELDKVVTTDLYAMKKIRDTIRRGAGGSK